LRVAKEITADVTVHISVPAVQDPTSHLGPLASALSPRPSLAVAKAFFLMSLALLTLSLLCASPAQAQYPGGGSGGGYPGGGWTVTDQVGNALPSDPNGGGYRLRGPMTGSASLAGAYPDVFTAAQQPNPTVGYAFIPNPNDYQGWLLTGAPDSGYDPYHVWTTAQASNHAGTSGGGTTGYLGMPWNENINGSITSNTGGTLWAVFQWNGSSQPPDHIDVLLRTTVSASAAASTYGNPPQAGGSSTATATDSTFNETATADSGGGGVPLVTGRHLLRVGVDPNTKKAQVSLGGTTTATATASVPYGMMGSYPGTTSGGYYQVTNGAAGANASASIGATASLDSREVAIQSTLEPTWHKDSNGSPAQNVRAASGFMVADTLAPDSSTVLRVQYSPLYSRSAWGSSSQYLWHSNDYSPDDAGTFNTYFHPDVSSPYVSYSSPTITPGSNDYITLTLTDSADGATASNNYSVLFHDYYEQWTRKATKTHPGAFTNPDGSQNTEWTRLIVNDNDSPASPSVHLALAYSGSITETGTIGIQGSLTAPGVAALQKNENITNGQTATGTVTTTYDFVGFPWSRITYYVAKTYEERTGTTDAYLGNGFQGTQIWYAIAATNPMYMSLHSELEQSYPPR